MFDNSNDKNVFTLLLKLLHTLNKFYDVNISKFLFASRQINAQLIKLHLESYACFLRAREHK